MLADRIKQLLTRKYLKDIMLSFVIRTNIWDETQLVTGVQFHIIGIKKDGKVMSFHKTLNVQLQIKAMFNQLCTKPDRNLSPHNLHIKHQPAAVFDSKCRIIAKMWEN